MITKCKQTAENSCSLFYKQKKQQFHVIGPLISPLLIIFQLMSLFFSTRVLKTNSAQKTYIFVVKGKKKFHPKQKICSSKLGILYKKPSPLPFLQLCIPQFENDFSFLTTKKNSFFQFCLFLIKREKLKKS